MTLDSPLRRRLALGAALAAAITASIAVPTPSQSAQHAAHGAVPHHGASATARQLHARGGRLVVPPPR